MTQDLALRPDAMTVERCVAGAGALDAASEVGVLELLSTHRCTIEEVASTLDLDRRFIRFLLDALSSVGAVRLVNGRYEAVISSERLDGTRRLWAALPDALRSGNGPIDVSRGEDGTTYAPVIGHLARLTEPLLGEVVGALDGLGPRVLDVGAGAASWTRTLAAADPTLHVTVLDHGDVLEQTRGFVESDRLGERFSYRAGDVSETDLGGPYDLVLVAGLCRLYGGAWVVRMLERLVGAMAPGATLAVLDALPDEDRADGDSNALYALGLALRTSTGGIHSFSSYAAWLHGVGLVDIQLTLLDRPELSLIRAIRPV